MNDVIEFAVLVLIFMVPMLIAGWIQKKFMEGEK